MMRVWVCLALSMSASAVRHAQRRNGTQLSAGAPSAVPAAAPVAAPAAATPVAAPAAAQEASMRGSQKNATAVNGTSTQMVAHVVGNPQMHELQVCNAYAAGPLDVHVVNGEQKTTLATKLPYKTCKSFAQTMTVGDYLEFQTPETKDPVIVPSIPVGDTTALFVAYQKANVFSVFHHYFEQLKNAQVAVVDVAPAGATLEETSQPRASKLTCKNAQCGVGKVEVLPANTAEPLFPGQYELTVGQEPTALNLDLMPGKCYAVLRLNKDSLMVFPDTAPPPATYQSGAAPAVLAPALFTALLGLGL